ncbi:hypothetical protein C8T65DRAFT_742367 [Cerioporus squamosus]|nr:hypothetical protein C8T65DRAFT_742367 [Cerioporus squamosus]
MQWDWSHLSETRSYDDFRPYTHTSDTQVTVELDTKNNAINFAANTHIYRQNRKLIPLGRMSVWTACTVEATLTAAANCSPSNTCVTLTRDPPSDPFKVQSNAELFANMKKYLDGIAVGRLNLVHDVAEASKTHSQFVFPGGGVFFIKDPLFNDDGDVVVGLTYKQE